jgi:hypothetical protein
MPFILPDYLKLWRQAIQNKAVWHKIDVKLQLVAVWQFAT